jgi:serine/threonine protein phosphatase PrpC
MEPVHMPVLISFAAGTDVGRARASNEDSAYAGRWLQAVADGMGGHVAGEVASAIAIRSLRLYDAPVAAPHLVAVLGRSVAEANAAILRRTEEEPALRSMGTTLTAMLWSGKRVAVAHIGDSRGYLLRGGRLRQITEDHTLGMLLSGARKSANLSGVMSRYLDGRPDRSPDLALRQASAGDRYLLCSDGLCGVVPTAAVRDVLTRVSDPGDTVRELIQLANDAGGPDNITVIVVDVHEDGSRVEGQQAMTLGAAAEVPL